MPGMSDGVSNLRRSLELRRSAEGGESTQLSRLIDSDYGRFMRRRPGRRETTFCFADEPLILTVFVLEIALGHVAVNPGAIRVTGPTESLFIIPHEVQVRRRQGPLAAVQCPAFHVEPRGQHHPGVFPPQGDSLHSLATLSSTEDLNRCEN